MEVKLIGNLESHERQLQVAPVCLSRHFHHKIFVHATKCICIELGFLPYVSVPLSKI